MSGTPGTPAKRGDSTLRRSLAQPGFRRFLAARTTSQWGDTFNAVALVILVYRLTGSGLKVGAAVVFEVVPVVAFSFLAGALVDRLPRRRVMIAAAIGRALIALGRSLSHNNLAVIYAAAFGLSALTVFFNPAAASVVPALAGQDNVVGRQLGGVVGRRAVPDRPGSRRRRARRCGRPRPRLRHQRRLVRRVGRPARQAPPPRSTSSCADCAPSVNVVTTVRQHLACYLDCPRTPIGT